MSNKIDPGQKVVSIDSKVVPIADAPSWQVMHDRDMKERARRYTRRRIGVAAVGLTVLFGAGSLANTVLRTPSAHISSVESDAAKSANTASDSVFLIKAGANIRTAPVVTRANEGPLPSTLKGTVPEGMVLRADRPLLYTDQDGDQWIGFNYAGDTDGNTSNKNSKLLWVNLNGNRADNYNEYVTPEIAAMSVNEQAEAMELPVDRNAQGEYELSNGDTYQLASAVMETVSAANEYLHKTGLVQYL